MAGLMIDDALSDIIRSMRDNFRRDMMVNFGIIAAAIILFGAAFYWFSSDISAQAKKIVDDHALIEHKAAAIESLADLKRNSVSAVVYKQAMDTILVSQDQLLTFPNWLDGLSRARQVAINFSFQGSQVASSGDSPGYIKFSLNVSGNIDDITSFIKDMEYQGQKFLVGMDSLSMSGGGESYNVSLSGRVFFK